MSQLFRMFEPLKCWFEAIERKRALRPQRIVFNGGRRHFYVHKRELEPPDPQYLTIHAVCAKVAFASGVVEYVDRALRDLEMTVLREGGSSLDVLMFALYRIYPLNLASSRKLICKISQ
ncbi:hypothetical protein FRC08_000841 [Ceratobasidium sp. 394]|nr:hypothetical protein FRC08_000841 [Ceratobasidium sp. 394]